MKSVFSFRPLLLATALLLGGIAGLRAEDVLFIGNSYTFGGPVDAIRKPGGVPKLVEAIAASKGKKLSTMMLTAGGKDWAYHLAQPATDKDLAAQKWDYVVLQDFSTKPTHLGNLEAFYQEGETFYKRIRKADPQAKIVLFETWARGKGNPMYSGTSTPKTFVDQAEMAGELQKAYPELQRRLEALEPGNQVMLAPVGLAF
jgi:hypothetical protein